LNFRSLAPSSRRRISRAITSTCCRASGTAPAGAVSIRGARPLRRELTPALKAPAMPQQLETNHHGVQGVFHLVRHAADRRPRAASFRE
jgi:hypothetical protein